MTNQIRIEYAPPKTPAQRVLSQRLKQARFLENVQALLSPLRLPHPLLMRVANCDGESNAWYEDGSVTVCYEYLDDVLKHLPKGKQRSALTQQDVILGSYLDVFLHETGHAAFDLLKVPVLGREEDAADMFSAYIMLRFRSEDAHRLILGSASQYDADVIPRQMPKTFTAFADEHELPAQRFFNLICFAYGFDQTTFADLAKILPKERAEGCDVEYAQSAFAFKKLIDPYIDERLAKKVFAKLPQTMAVPSPSAAPQPEASQSASSQSGASPGPNSPPASGVALRAKRPAASQ